MSQEVEAPAVTRRVTRHTVSALPEDHDDASVFDIHVEYRGVDMWVVRRLGRCLGIDGTWSHECWEDPDWVASHLFPVGEALKLAEQASPRLRINGWSVAEVLAGTRTAGLSDGR